MSCPTLPVNIATQWIAAQVKRHLSHLPPRSLEHCGRRFTLDFKTSEYCVGESRSSLFPLFASNTPNANSELTEFENDDAVVYVSIPPSANYPLAIDGGIAVSKDIVVIFSTGSPMCIYKLSVTSIPDDFIARDLFSSTNHNASPSEEFRDYPKVRAQILADIAQSLLPKEELETVKSDNLFRVTPFWKNVQDLYAKHNLQAIYFYRTLFPEETDKNYSLVKLRAQMMKDIEDGVLPPETAAVATSPRLFLALPYYHNVLDVYKCLGVSTPIPILQLIAKIE